MGTFDFLKELQGKVLDAATYQLLERNFKMQSENNRLLQENNDLLQQRIESLVQEIEQLKDENKRLRQEQLNTNSDLFYEIEGLIWKKRSEGGYESKPRCPICSNRPTLHQFPPGGKMHWCCSSCDATFDYAGPPEL